MKAHFRSVNALSLCLLLMACQRVPKSEELISSNQYVRDKAVKDFAKLKESKKSPFVGPMTQALHDPDPQVNQRAVEALVLIGAPAVQALIPLLKDPDVFIRLCAAHALGRIGQPSEAAVPDLISALSDHHPLVKEEAAFALKKIGNPEALAALEKLPKKART